MSRYGFAQIERDERIEEDQREQQLYELERELIEETLIASRERALTSTEAGLLAAACGVKLFRHMEKHHES